MASSKKVGVKVMVDKVKRRVVLAESSNDFVDILFSFLTMPLGTVIRVAGLNKSPSSLGSIVNIYESVANLDTSCFWTEACKTMLLRPRNSAEETCEDLAVNIDDTEPGIFFTCKDCYAKSKMYGSIPGTRCSCGQLMSRVAKWKRTYVKAQGDGVFVDGGLRFLITDELNVDTASLAILMRTFKTLEIEDARKLEERNLELGFEEIVSFLWRTLTSRSPLTDLCFNTPEKEVPARGTIKDVLIQPKQESESSDVGKRIKLKLVLDKQSNKVVFAEADSDMVDLLFGWLAFPLGLLAKHAKDMLNGCIGNLIKCAECNGLMKSDECKSLLLSPELDLFHGCSSQLLNADEMVYETPELMVNPRSTCNGTEVTDGYARASIKYMVTNDLRVLPFSLQNFFQIITEFNILTTDIVEREVSLGVTQASDLLRAAFASRTPLSDVFSPAKKRRRLP